MVCDETQRRELYRDYMLVALWRSISICARSSRRRDDKTTNERAYQHNKEKEKYSDLAQRKVSACVLLTGESRQFH